jgi:hypothetical protein
MFDPGTVTTGHVASIIQTAVAPVFLLAGIGSFLNVCALRMARIVDRARQLEPKILASRDREHQRLLSELHVLDRRIGIVNWAIFFTVLSAVLICSVVVLLFSGPFVQTHLGLPIAALFILSIIAIGVGFSIFLVETRIASRSARIRVELLEHQPADAD